ncbi:MAG TPA: hypothetical protein VII49_10185 [Rhizomicrobium sp.]
MIRVLNFFCVAVTAFTCLALNHVSDQTRVAQARLHRTQVEFSAAADSLKILQADWQRAANPERIQALAAVHLGLADTATVQVASLELLPRRGDATPTGGVVVTTASVAVPAVNPPLHLVSARAGE